MTTRLELAVFAVGLLAGVLLLAGVWASVLGVADYYPPGERDWRFYALWGLSHLLSVTLVVLGYLQWGSLGLPRVPALVAGGALFVGGYAVAIAAGLDLGVEETKCLEGELHTGGWYRYSRNPQYVGYILATVGFALAANATLVAPLCAIYLVWWVTLPLAEEPWLREQYGEAYERYAADHPRFLGRQTLRALRARFGRRPDGHVDRGPADD
ncbi:isoprenylcysteine carboxylmethyltransferase family protein [Haloarcula sp. JP-L23]|uniref:methyltransferase family protein n=1 Tax=Haloarcula sp. JP-L23 TaxID=2716717 RepID=UPI00140ECFA7|nr:DUF1295 domain-containing protein [Haloarcula sp. JP-L23]